MIIFISLCFRKWFVFAVLCKGLLTDSWWTSIPTWDVSTTYYCKPASKHNICWSMLFFPAGLRKHLCCVVVFAACFLNAAHVFFQTDEYFLNLLVFCLLACVFLSCSAVSSQGHRTRLLITAVQCITFSRTVERLLVSYEYALIRSSSLTELVSRKWFKSCV